MEKKKQTEGTVFISEADQYLFAQGTHYDIYKKLGAHPSVENGRKGTFFGVWAPNAASVHVIGTFNGWNEEAAPMTKLGAGARSYIRQILLPTAQKCAPGLHQKRLIFPAINGQTICGSGNVKKGTIIKSRWQFMNVTSVPG